MCVISRVFVLTALVAAPSLLGGCGSDEPAAIMKTDQRFTPRRPVDTSLDAIGGDDAVSSPSALQAMAAQSQRDVEAILEARRATSQDAASASPMTPNQPASEPGAPAPKPVVIQWDELRPANHEAAPSSAVPEPATHPPAHDQPPAAPLPAASQPDIEQPAAALAALPQDGAPDLSPDRIKQLMVDLSRQLHANAAYSDAPLKELLAISAMSLVDSERVLNPDALPDLTEQERELLAALQRFFVELNTSLADADDVRGAVANAAVSLQHSLVKRPELRLSTIALCTRVGGFGDYTPFDKQSFLAHNEQKTIVYAEIDEFSSVPNEKGEFVTELSQQLTIYSDRDGIPVWKEDWQAAVDVSKNQRQDFFTVQVITLPKALSVGKYTLKIRVRDEKSGAETEGSVPIEMVADPRLASSIH